MKIVNTAVRKVDAMQLVTGKPVYTEDLAPKDCLIVKLLRSPHAHAWVKEINTQVAMKVPGIEAIYTWKDIPQDGHAIPRPDRPIRKPALMTGCSSTVTSAMWAILWPLWRVRMRNAWIRP